MQMSSDMFVKALGKVEVKRFKDRFVTSQVFSLVFALKKILRKGSIANRERGKN